MRTDGPNPRLGLAILRVVVGVTFVAHGAPKLFQGGVGGLAVTLGELGVPLQHVVAWLVTLVEFFGGVALVVGLLVTPAALVLSVHMLTGIVLVHGQAGWYVLGPQARHPPGGVELNVLLVAALLVLVLAGPGAAAVDRLRGEGGAGGGRDAPAGSGEVPDASGETRT